jgi:hypothetical protein
MVDREMEMRLSPGNLRKVSNFLYHSFLEYIQSQQIIRKDSQKSTDNN